MGGIGSSVNRVGSGTGNNPNPYSMNYQQNGQGEQGSIGSSGSRRDDKVNLPALNNNIPSYGQG